MPSARSDNAIACGFPTLFARAFDCCDESLAQLPARRIRASGSRLDRHRAGDTVRFAGIERHEQVTRAEVRSADHVHHASPVAADQQVSMRRSASASISSTRRGTKRSPRHRSRSASPQQRQQRRARASGRTHAHAREHAANQVQAAIDVPADEELLGRAPLELHSLGVTCTVGRAADRLRRPRPAGRRWRARRRVLLSRLRRQAKPAPAPAPAGRRTRPDRRRARRRLSRRRDRPESTRSRDLRRPDSARTAPRSRRFASRRAPAP